MLRRHNLKTQVYTRQDYIQDNFKPGEEPWEVRRARIARQAEQSANLSGNEAAPEFEAFAIQYSFTLFA